MKCSKTIETRITQKWRLKTRLAWFEKQLFRLVIAELGWTSVQQKECGAEISGKVSPFLICVDLLSICLLIHKCGHSSKACLHVYHSIPKFQKAYLLKCDGVWWYTASKRTSLMLQELSTWPLLCFIWFSSINALSAYMQIKYMISNHWILIPLVNLYILPAATLNTTIVVRNSVSNGISKCMLDSEVINRPSACWATSTQTKQNCGRIDSC